MGTISMPTPPLAMTPTLLGEGLAVLLREFTSVYERLASSVRAHRDAIARADHPAMVRASQAQQLLTREASTCDQRRRELVLRCVRAFPILAHRQVDKVTLSELAQCAPDAMRGSLSRAAASLRSLVARVSAELATLRDATLTLAAHMEGVVRHVGRSLSPSGTYSRRGVVEAGGGVVGAMDIAG